MQPVPELVWLIDPEGFYATFPGGGFLVRVSVAGAELLVGVTRNGRTRYTLAGRFPTSEAAKADAVLRLPGLIYASGRVRASGHASTG